MFLMKKGRGGGGWFEKVGPVVQCVSELRMSAFVTHHHHLLVLVHLLLPHHHYLILILIQLPLQLFFQRWGWCMVQDKV